MNPDVTIEAEYGDEVVEGSIGTLAHHGKRSMNPAPCLYKNGIYDGVSIVGLSHIDLDTIGGCLAVLGIKPNAKEFWETAGFVDVAGPHKLNLISVNEEVKLQLAAYWAWSTSNRIFAPRDGSIIEVTDKVMEASEVINKILNNDEEMLEAGRAFLNTENELNKNSFVELFEGTIIRVSNCFCNHLYNTPDGDFGDSVVTFNTITRTITLSFSDSDDKRDAGKIMKNLFGCLAGGNKGIAGSPRGQKIRFGRVFDVVENITESVYTF